MNAIRIANPLKDRRTVEGQIDAALEELHDTGTISAEWASINPRRAAAIKRLKMAGEIKWDGRNYVRVRRSALRRMLDALGWRMK